MPRPWGNGCYAPLPRSSSAATVSVDFQSIALVPNHQTPATSARRREARRRQRPGAV